MARNRTPHPTEAELTILRILWDRGPSTVRDVYETLHKSRYAYTTILKILQIMIDKGYVTRDESQRSHVYRAKISEDQAQRQVVKQMMRTAFSGSASQLVMKALSVKKTSAKELAEIRRLLDGLEDGAK